MREHNEEVAVQDPLVYVLERDGSKIYFCTFLYEVS